MSHECFLGLERLRSQTEYEVKHSSVYIFNKVMRAKAVFCLDKD